VLCLPVLPHCSSPKDGMKGTALHSMSQAAGVVGQDVLAASHRD